MLNRNAAIATPPQTFVSSMSFNAKAVIALTSAINPTRSKKVIWLMSLTIGKYFLIVFFISFPFVVFIFVHSGTRAAEFVVSPFHATDEILTKVRVKLAIPEEVRANKLSYGFSAARVPE